MIKIVFLKVFGEFEIHQGDLNLKEITFLHLNKHVHTHTHTHKPVHN